MLSLKNYIISRLNVCLNVINIYGHSDKIKVEAGSIEQQVSSCKVLRVSDWFVKCNVRGNNNYILNKYFPEMQMFIKLQISRG